MCAIAGLLSSRPQRLGFIRKMADLMAHRGPDDEGFVLAGSAGVRVLKRSPDSSGTPPSSSGGILKETAPDLSESWLALGHRRLSILDLSPQGHQPMPYRGRYWIVYNGEVYNYLELRSELQQSGHTFNSNCDTEVILAAFAQWGTDCFARFNGMWALAIYDVQTHQLVLARDRFGIKPLYYWRDAETFGFASEIKAFTCLPGWRPRVNGQAVHDFLLAGLQDHSTETMFADVLQLEPGSWARLDCAAWKSSSSTPSPAALEVKRWYHLQPRPFSGTPEEAADRFREMLVDSVRLRLRADVPVGSCLSGGLDSSSIVCATHQLLAAQAVRSAHKTFSACSELKSFDEREFIELVVRATGVDSHYTFPSMQGLFGELDKLIWHQDEPFAGTSIYAQWCVFGSAAFSGIKVMLDGQGADELLCGYSYFHRPFLCGLIRSGQWLAAWREAQAARGGVQKGFSSFIRAVLDAAIPVSTQSAFRRFRRGRPPPWLHRSVLRATFPGRLTSSFRRHRSAREMSLELLSGAHLQMLLHWEDRNSMAHSLESRVPFLDYRLVEFVTGLPDHYKIRAGRTKNVLRAGMKKIVPDAVLQRRDKMGFVTPEEVWARESEGEVFRQRLAEAIAAAKGIIAADAGAQFEKCLTGQSRYDPAVWRILCLGAWMRLFNVAV